MVPASRPTTAEPFKPITDQHDGFHRLQSRRAARNSVRPPPTTPPAGRPSRRCRSRADPGRSVLRSRTRNSPMSARPAPAHNLDSSDVIRQSYSSSTTSATRSDPTRSAEAEGSAGLYDVHEANVSSGRIGRDTVSRHRPGYGCSAEVFSGRRIRQRCCSRSRRSAAVSNDAAG